MESARDFERLKQVKVQNYQITCLQLQLFWKLSVTILFFNLLPNRYVSKSMAPGKNTRREDMALRNKREAMMVSQTREDVDIVAQRNLHEHNAKIKHYRHNYIVSLLHNYRLQHINPSSGLHLVFVSIYKKRNINHRDCMCTHCICNAVSFIFVGINLCIAKTKFSRIQ